MSQFDPNELPEEMIGDPIKQAQERAKQYAEIKGSQAFPKFQYSVMIGGHQIVVRELENIKAFVAAIGDVKPLIEALKEQVSSQPKTASSSAPVSQNTMTCQTHGVAMEERIGKTSGKPYFSHKDPITGNFCFGEGYKEKKRY